MSTSIFIKMKTFHRDGLLLSLATVIHCHGITVEELKTRKLSARTNKEAHHKAAIMDKSPSSTIRHSCVIQDDSEEPQTLVAYFSNHPDSDGVEDFEVHQFVNITQQAISELSLKSPERAPRQSVFIMTHNNPVPSTDLLQTGSAHKAQAATHYSINVDQQSSLLNAYVECFFPQEYATLN
ncbi:hypothetical protein EV421DRAFT_1742097 [Armillaria borealis]|uniref:Uncharacterized protein n=1 Tax=Armillaria borealis TaxID=47425 RepID=A0AA39MG87_9AGAR|nr:hypothetical protein EV421DRAFT_1742097 [Armillaria borealis]